MKELDNIEIFSLYKITVRQSIIFYERFQKSNGFKKVVYGRKYFIANLRKNNLLGIILRKINIAC